MALVISMLKVLMIIDLLSVAILIVDYTMYTINLVCIDSEFLEEIFCFIGKLFGWIFIWGIIAYVALSFTAGILLLFT